MKLVLVKILLLALATAVLILPPLQEDIIIYREKDSTKADEQKFVYL